MDGLPSYYCDIVEDSIERNMSKEETMRYIQNEYVIPPQDTNRGWNHLESTNPDLFIAYNATIRERTARIPPLVAQPSPPEVTSGRRRRLRRLSPRRASRPLFPDLNVAIASPQEAVANANAIENQNLQASQQQPAYPSDDFWQLVMNTLGQIQSNIQHLDTLGQIQSNTDQVLKLLTDGYGFGSLKRQRAAEAEAEERGNSNEEEAENQQKKEEGNDEEVQKKEEGNDEELQRKEGGDNE